jgi:peptidoglycan/LPS O-acetylase OafA/YrhL
MGRNFGHVALPFIIVPLYLAGFRGRICSAVLSNRDITDIGGMCYSIYLFHFFVIYGVKHLTAPLHVGQNFFGVHNASLWDVFLLIECPCMDREWPRKLWKQGQSLMPFAARTWQP